MVWRILCLAAIQWAAWFGSAIVAYGTDLDQLSSRSVVASVAAPVCALLEYPHDVLLHAVPASWLQRVPQVALAVVLAASLSWSVALVGAWRLTRAIAKCAKAPHEPAPLAAARLGPTPEM